MSRHFLFGGGATCACGEPTFNPRARAVNCGRRKTVHAHTPQPSRSPLLLQVPASAVVRTVPRGAGQRGCSGRVRGVSAHAQRGGLRPP